MATPTTTTKATNTTTTTSAPKATATLPTLPALPRMPRKPKAPKACCCGCAAPTRGGRFLPGHDAILHGWARRVARGLVDAAPEPHTAAVAAFLAAEEAKATGKATAAA